MNVENLANHDPLTQMVLRSRQLHDHLMSLSEEPEEDSPPQHEMAYGMCLVAIEQATALRGLAATGLVTSAACMMRVQFETLTRAAWLVSAADESAVSKFDALLKEDGERAAKRLPDIEEMIEQIGRTVGDRTSFEAHQSLLRSKTLSWHTMNSFVHGGISQLLINGEVAEAHLALQVIKNSNDMLVLTGTTLAMLAMLAGNHAAKRLIAETPRFFSDCLPSVAH